MFDDEIKVSLLTVWLVIGIVIFTVLITPFILPAQTVKDLAPVCEWKIKYNKTCPLCGMTRAFINISAGNFYAAQKLNRFSVGLYSIFILNEIVTLTFLLFCWRRWIPLFKLLFSNWVSQHELNEERSFNDAGV